MKKIIYFKPPPREEEDSNRALAKEQEELSLLDNKIINDDNISKIELDDINARRSQLMQDMTSMRLESLKQANDPIISEIKAKISNIGGEFTSSNFMSIHADLSDEQAEIIKELDCVLEIKDWEPVEFEEHLRYKIQSSGASTFWRGDEGVVNQYTGKHFNVALMEPYCDILGFGLYNHSVIFHSQIPAFDNISDSHGAKVASVIGVDYMYPDGVPCQGIAYEFDTLIVSYPILHNGMAPTLEWLISQSKKPHVVNWSGGIKIPITEDQSGFAKDIDKFVFEMKVPVIKSAGNDGHSSADPTIQQGTDSFNSIVVGAMADFNTFHRAWHNIALCSSRGPWNYKGAEVKKPDLVAPGGPYNLPFRHNPDLGMASVGEMSWPSNIAGSSFAAPFVSGSCLLLKSAGISDHRQIKAVLINSADSYDEILDHPVHGKNWSSLHGWGYLNLQKALVERKNSFLINLQPYEEKHYLVCFMPVFSKVTIVYDKDPNREVALVELWLHDYHSNAVEDKDISRYNNVKQVSAKSTGHKVVVIKNNNLEAITVAVAATVNISHEILLDKANKLNSRAGNKINLCPNSKNSADDKILKN